MGNILEKIKGLNKFKKAGIALLLSAVIAAETYFVIDKDDERDKIYLVNLNDDYQNELLLEDKKGNALDISTNNVFALTFTKKGKKGEKVEVVIIDKDGNMKSGYVDGQSLDRKIIDKIRVDEKLISQLNNIGVVVPENGTVLKEETGNKNNPTNDVFLGEGQNLILTDSRITESEDSLKWQEAITVVNDGNKPEIIKGAVATDYLRSNNFDEIEGTKVTVNISDGFLYLRDEAKTSSKVLVELKNDDEVVLLPNSPKISDGDYDWFRVAVIDKKTDSVVNGYIAGAYHKDGVTLNYLTPKEKKEDENIQISDRIYKVVDIKSENENEEVYLREMPTEKGKVISKIENGTVVFINRTDKKVIKHTDGQKWMLVHTNNGYEGYIEANKLKDFNIKPVKDGKTKTQTFGKIKPYKVKGYYGLNVNNETTKLNFEKLINSDSFKDQKEGYSRKYSFDSPKFIMIQLGETSKTDGSIIENNDLYSYRIQNIIDMINLCEEHKIPYGFYYDLHGINETDTKNQIEYITKAVNEFGGGRYNLLPISISFNNETIKTNDTKESKKTPDPNKKAYTTKFINKCMNTIRENTDRDVIVELDDVTCSKVIDYALLEVQNRKNMCIVEFDDNYSSSYREKIGKYGEFIGDAAIRQIAQNQVYGETIYNVSFMDATYYNKLIEDLRLELTQSGKTM